MLSPQGGVVELQTLWHRREAALGMLEHSIAYWSTATVQYMLTGCTAMQQMGHSLLMLLTMQQQTIAPVTQP